MDLFPDTPYTGNIETTHSISPVYKPYIIPVARGISIQGPFGVLLEQELAFDIFIFRYYVLVIQEERSFYVETTNIQLSLWYMLENHISFHAKEHPTAVVLWEGQFQFSGLPTGQYNTLLAPGNYRFCRLDLKWEHLAELSDTYKLIQVVLHKAERNSPAVFRNEALAIPVEALLLLQCIFEVTETGVLGRMSIESNAKKLLLLSLDELEAQCKTPAIIWSDKQTHEKIKGFIKNNLDKKLTIDLLCRQFKVGKTKLQEGFTLLSGKSVHQFIIEERVNMAKLLLVTDASVSDVALKVGYVETSNFIRMFKQVTGMTPMQYRNLHGRLDY
jgi:AraC-like DNA-binding protein